MFDPLRISQVAEALAADMIDPRRAQGLLKALRFAKENIKDSLKDDDAHWHDTPYLTEDATLSLHHLFISFTALLQTPGTRKRPPRSGFVQTRFDEVSD